MLWFFCFIVFFGFSESAVDEKECGISPAVERYKIYNPNRIIGGEKSAEGDFPWYVWQQSDIAGCSGTIIHERWILTAAHCFKFNQTNKNYRAYYGSVKWSPRKNISGSEYYIHPSYTHAPFYKNDIALVKLAESLEFSERVQPVCLNGTLTPEKNEILVIAGMGRDFKMFKSNELLLETQNNLRDSPIQYRESPLLESQLYFEGYMHSPIIGDSGGPLMVIRDNRFVQIGICSAGRRTPFQDDPLSVKFENFYTKISFFCDWIKETTNNEVQC